MDGEAKAAPDWPPRSPRHVWLNSPTRQRRLRQVAAARTSRSLSPSPSPSPSPSKRPRGRRDADTATGPVPGGDNTAAGEGDRDGNGNGNGNEDGDEDEDEDEETLRLKIEAIETRLKLKRLQRKTRQDTASRQRDALTPRPGPAAATPSTSMATSVSMATSTSTAAAAAHAADANKALPNRTRPAAPRPVQVPVSPTPVRAPPNPASTARAQTQRIVKGLGATDVTLKRTSTTKTRPTHAGQVSSKLSRSKSHADLVKAGSNDYSQSTAPRPASFSERLAVVRERDRHHEAKEERLSRSRSTGFGLTAGSLRCGDDSRPTSASLPAKAAGNSVHRTQQSQTSASSAMKSVPTLRSSSDQKAESSHPRLPRPPMPTPTPTPTPLGTPSATDTSSPGDRTGETAASNAAFDSFSEFHLSKRTLTQTHLTRLLDGKDLYSIPRLLKTVKGPDFEAPDTETDFAIFGIIAWKSTPYGHKSSVDGGGQQRLRSKFIVIKLVDLKWELDLFLFDSGFERFWKLTVGTVVALLNPGVMPPRDRDTGRFSLKLSSSEDTILEIGSARDLGFCKSIKKDGQECRSWVDCRRTEFCDFHVSLQLEKTKAGRMEVNASAVIGTKSAGRGATNSSLRSTASASSSASRRGRAPPEDGLLKEGRVHDRYLHETYYVAPSAMNGMRSAVSLLDAEGELSSRNKKIAARRRAVEHTREKELAKKLSVVGNGIGSEYMRVHHSQNNERPSATGGQDKQEDATAAMVAKKPPDAVLLGLVGDSAAVEAKMAAAKRKRSSKGGSLAEPVGWSSALRRGLPPTTKSTTPANANETQQETSPSKKRARFMLDKGIREPGRDSLGLVEGNGMVDNDGNDDDDDGLDIQRS